MGGASGKGFWGLTVAAGSTNVLGLEQEEHI